MLCPMPLRTQLALLAARALLTHIQFGIDQVPFHSTAFQHLIPQSVQISRVVPSQVQDPDLSLAGLHSSLVELHSWRLPSPLICQSFSASEGVKSSSQFYVICRLAQYPFQSCIQVIFEDVEEHKAQNGALWNPTSDRSPV
ncbi:hypothetical protein WISP_111569 [Willisornis vidua]|uniref:Secreted protein n=1 Tax=Willisornis vidua TaxID=1566151 RepID=A0ABQ9CVH2_9PASS|nr:hypothetical protein WISP_111569 [Willisornis vidua]